MNRKLQHSVTALSATAAVFGLLLLAGGPPPMAMPMPGAEALVAVETIEASPADMAEGESAARRHRHQRRARSGLALPYFSFAQGLRTVTGS
ncbi:hypothetical protein QAA18_05720 [Luteimonas sp. 8-5]|jgi:hypothetical protein|uniref:hypothetical protein n=1 Tax=Luteimonas sp. 8-5 TaxID=3039387 RepID=UPI002436EA82|nr:hypothetical protein [Luteimonas sp. 8-5]MDG6348242.1 hypothetical protein [Luteimonas sp. 8-5]